MAESEYIGIEQVANRYPGQTPSGLYAQRHRGEAPGVLAVRIGRRLIWRVSDLEAWFDAKREEQLRRVAS